MSHHATLPSGEASCPACGTAFQETQTSALVTLSVDTAGDRLVVNVSGELDLQSDQLLQQTLSNALDHASGGLELDLAGVDFCDCSGLNVLMKVRDQARASAKSFVLRATSPAVRRLLSLAGVLPLFTAGASDADQGSAMASEVTTQESTPADRESTPADAPALPDPRPEQPAAGPAAKDGPPAKETARRPDPPSTGLEAENAQLQQALKSRPTIDLARGMLMASFRLNPKQSWQVLVTASQHSNTKLHLIADALLQTTDGRALPAALAGHLATAVQAHSGSAV